MNVKHPPGPGRRRAVVTVPRPAGRRDRRRPVYRLANAVLTTGVLTTGVAAGGAPASAADASPPGPGAREGVSAVLKHSGIGIGGLIAVEGDDEPYYGGLITLTTRDGGTILTYCIEFGIDLDWNSPYQEGKWAETSTLKGNKDAGKVNWVLQNSYPKIPTGELGKLIGSDVSDDEAAAATQAAVWHFSDHITAVPTEPVAAKLADYLVSHAKDFKEPGASLTLGRAEVGGESGTPLGPIEITSASAQVDARLDTAAVAIGTALTDKAGNVLSDADGKLLRPAKSGDSLYVKAPADARPGSATVSATTSLRVPIGRAFVSPGNQSLIVAGSTVVSATAQATATWTTPEPTPTKSPAPTGSPTSTTSPTAVPSHSPPPTPSAGGESPGGGWINPTPATSEVPRAEGPLADTGAQAPYGRILALTGAALACGAGLVVLIRRRRRRAH
ncbi:thioester domain-containing protein [Streptomyces sp. NPDC085665]|uniref:thioester domain-containing protein n=1 Tax=Streptomyces sp. NPDC085665 TaxID=3365735 RepID=UPI0037D7E482